MYSRDKLSILFQSVLSAAAVLVALTAPDPAAGGVSSEMFRVAGEPALPSPGRVAIALVIVAGLIVHLKAVRWPWR